MMLNQKISYMIQQSWKNPQSVSQYYNIIDWEDFMGILRNSSFCHLTGLQINLIHKKVNTLGAVRFLLQDHAIPSLTN